MSRRIRYTDKRLDMEVMPDFLPPPDKLVLKDQTVKVTISLSRPSVEFFKRKARAQRTPYQKMIRRVLDLYAERYGMDELHAAPGGVRPGPDAARHGGGIRAVGPSRKAIRTSGGAAGV